MQVCGLVCGFTPATPALTKEGKAALVQCGGLQTVRCTASNNQQLKEKSRERRKGTDRQTGRREGRKSKRGGKTNT